MVQLTKLVKTSGCAAKLPVGKLEEVLSSIKMERKENLQKFLLLRSWDSTPNYILEK